MDVGNDPFPRDEVTGLGAFDNLEPVSALNVMPEPAPAPVAQPARTFTRPIGVAPALAVRGEPHELDRPDQTEILDLSKVETVREDAAEDSPWDDDEATSILTAAAFRPAPAAPELRHPAAEPRAAGLAMDWDEDEPPTRMRDDISFLPPLGSSRRAPANEWEPHQEQEPRREPAPRYEDHASAGYPPVDLSVPVPPVGRPSPFPMAGEVANQYLPPLAEPIAERGGAPSPFSAVTARAPTVGMAGKPAWMLVTAGAVVAVSLLLIGRVIIGSSEDASITITTTPADARVYVDGKPVSGMSSPFAVSPLSEGPHELVVQKDGFTEHRSVFSVDDGENRWQAVELAAKRAETGFAVNSIPSGATILVDGAAIGQLTPAKVTGIAPGVHKLQLQLAAHTDFELQVLVPDSGILQLPTAELVSNAVAAAPSRREVREPREARGPREPSSDSGTSKRRARSSMAEDRAAAPSRTEPAAPRGGGTVGGMLRLNSRPWSQVYVDGRLVGNTPQMGLPLEPGTHSIRLVNTQMGLTNTFSVSVKPGQMLTKIVNLVE